MVRWSLLLISILAVGLLALPSPARAGIGFGLMGGPNTNYAQGVMGGASSQGSGITRQATAFDNIVISRATTPRPAVCLPVLTAQIMPGCGMIFPPILLVSAPMPADPGLVPFAPGGTLVRDGAW